MIILKDVSKHFGDNIILDNLNCAIDAGEFIFFVGVSGVGKSTLLHMMIGAEHPTTGAILVDKINIADMNHHALQLYRRKVGMVFQDFKLLPRKTVYENVRFALDAIDEDFATITPKVMQALHEVGLQDKEDAFPEELSGGEKQRVAIARALVHEPNLIIADEPTGNLDPYTSRDIIQLLQKINQKRNVTVLIATHDQTVVNEMQQRVILIDQGKIIRDERNAMYS